MQVRGAGGEHRRPVLLRLRPRGRGILQHQLEVVDVLLPHPGEPVKPLGRVRRQRGKRGRRRDQVRQQCGAGQYVAARTDTPHVQAARSRVRSRWSARRRRPTRRSAQLRVGLAVSGTVVADQPDARAPASATCARTVAASSVSRCGRGPAFARVPALLTASVRPSLVLILAPSSLRSSGAALARRHARRCPRNPAVMLLGASRTSPHPAGRRDEECRPSSHPALPGPVFPGTAPAPALRPPALLPTVPDLSFCHRSRQPVYYRGRGQADSRLRWWPSVVESGTELAGRYRLDRRLGVRRHGRGLAGP